MVVRLAYRAQALHTLILIFLTVFPSSIILLHIMSHNRYMSWPDAHVLTMAPNYPPAGATTEYPSPAVSRRPSECFSEMSMGSSRRGSLAGFASDLESTGQWQSIGSESKSPLAQFGFFKSLTEKKTTRGMVALDSYVQCGSDKRKMARRRRGEVLSRTVNPL
jgi:hypothetical protein